MAGSKQKSDKRATGTKRKATEDARNFLQRIEQEDDFQEDNQAEAQTSNRSDDEEETSEEEDEQKLRIRALPSHVSNAFKKLTTQQRQSVHEMGHGKLLDLNIRNLPRKLALWLVENFDARSTTLRLQNGQSIHITEEDVAITLGLPRGPIEITKRKSRAVSNLLLQWRAIFNKTTSHITANVLCKKMLTVPAGDPWFKRHFALFVISMLIQPQTNGYVNQDYMDHLDDVSNLHNLNWCRMLIKSLVSSKIAWINSTDKVYSGPILFLMIFYVDRVVLYNRNVPRSIPAFKGWTTKLLQQREIDELKSGGFGFGHVDNALQIDNAPQQADIPRPEVPQAEVPPTEVPPQQPQQENPSIPRGLQDYVEELTTHTRTMAASLLKIVNLVKDAPKDILEDDTFKQMVESAKQILGFKTISQAEPQSTFSQRGDAFWSNPEFLKAVDEIEQAIVRRDDLDDMPSFSLGLTPDRVAPTSPTAPVTPAAPAAQAAPIAQAAPVAPNQGGQWEDINVIAREYQADPVPPNQVEDPNNATKETTPKEQGPQKQASDPPVLNKQKDKGERPLRQYTPARTPYHSLILEVNTPWSPTEETIKNWILENPDPKLDEEIFRFKNSVVFWRDLLSLKKDMEVAVGVIDCWATILNNMDGERNLGRFIASTFSTLYTVVNPIGEKDGRVKKFAESINGDLTNAANIDIRRVVLYMFPIVQSSHYYLLAINPLLERYEIIDNSSVNAKTEDKYGKTPEELKAVFSEFLKEQKLTYQPGKVKTLKPKRMRMPWRDAQNKKDCGIFLMRHMETFRDQPVESWKCGLEKGKKEQLDNLRIKYLAAIVTSRINEHKDRNMQRAAAFELLGSAQ